LVLARIVALLILVGAMFNQASQNAQVNRQVRSRSPTTKPKRNNLPIWVSLRAPASVGALFLLSAPAQRPRLVTSSSDCHREDPGKRQCPLHACRYNMRRVPC
jgi:hypothetical protein